MTRDQLTRAMEILCPKISYSYELSNGDLRWIRLEQAGVVCPTLQEITEQVNRGA